VNAAPAPPGPAAAEPRSKRVRPVVLRSGAAGVWPGGKLRLRAIVTSPKSPARAPAWAFLKVRRGQSWRRVGWMRRRGNDYRAIVRLGGTEREEFRRFGRTRVPRGFRALKLRALVPGVGISNLVLVQIARRPGG
jgi:hypothetical protein